MKTLLMRAWRRFGAYGLALAAALATAWAVREHVGQGEPEPVAANAPVVERLVAAEDLAAGTRLDESHLQRRQVPAAWAPRASLDPLAAQALLGAVLSADIDAGEIILPAHLLGQPAGQASTAPAALALPAGMRALNVTVADLGPLAGRLRVGDSVDVYASFVHDGKRNAAPVLLAAGPVRRRAGRRWRAGHGERHAGGPPRGCPALRRCPTGRHPDGHAASPGRRGGRGRRGSGRSGRLAGHARRIPSGGRRCHPLRRPAGRPGAARCGRRIRRRGRRGCDMALNRYRLAAMLGLCGCLAGVQAQTILVELEVGKAGCCPTGRAARGDRQRAGIARGRRRRAGNRHFRPRRGRVLGACLDGRWTAHRLCVQSRASRRGAPTCRGRGAARAHSVGPEHARRRQHRHRRRRSVRPGPRPHRRAGRALSVSAGPHGTGRLGPHGAAGRAGRGDPDLAPA